MSDPAGKGCDLRCQANQGVRLGVRIKADPLAVIPAGTLAEGSTEPKGRTSPASMVLSRPRSTVGSREGQRGTTSISGASWAGSSSFRVQFAALGSPLA
jgi:hypothetical protein